MIPLDQCGEASIRWDGDRDYHGTGLREPYVGIEDAEGECAIVDGLALYFALEKILKEHGALTDDRKPCWDA